ncbi:serine/threonine-protein kinase D6PKL1 [Tanacetum coccineum]
MTHSCEGSLNSLWMNQHVADPTHLLENYEYLAPEISKEMVRKGVDCHVFPRHSLVSSKHGDLIKGLLVKEPKNRLGSQKEAAEIKQHPFFSGLN